MRVGINLLWVRSGKNGGTESYIRNILDGLFLYSDEDEEYYLYVSKDNQDSFQKYFANARFIKRVCDIESKVQWKRIVWENFHLSNMGIRDKLDVWFMPVYSRPLYLSKKIPCITAIHDLQALHYPEYFSPWRNLYFRLMWYWDCLVSARVLTISNYCRDDILIHYPKARNKIEVIYNPIITCDKVEDFSVLSLRYGLKNRNYVYTVSSLAKHKNLLTVLKAVKKLKEKGQEIKLVITGVKVNAESEILSYVKNNELTKQVVFTGYISDEERDCLYDHCKLFVFPSVFEGFGMPPIEAMMRGVPVLATKETCIYEITQGKANYIQDPYNENEWVQQIEKLCEMDNRNIICFEQYRLENVTKRYRELFKNGAD